MIQTRTPEQIAAFIRAQVALKPSLAVIAANPSQAASWKDFVDAISEQLAEDEKLRAKFMDDMETLVQAAPPGSINWLRAKVFAWELGTVADDFGVYPQVTPSRRILTRVSVTKTDAAKMDIRVAKSEPPVKLSDEEIASLQSFCNRITPAGSELTAVSLDADRIYIAGTVYVDGQSDLSAVKTLVFAALNNYLKSTSQITYTAYGQGVVAFTEVIETIRGVPGVFDVFINSLWKRPATEPFGSTSSGAAKLVDSGAVTSPGIVLSTAGYSIEEDDTGHDFESSITFVTQ